MRDVAPSFLPAIYAARMGRTKFADSVPLTAPGSDDEPKNNGPPRLRVANLKLLIALFVSFLVVVSDVFTGAVIAGFGSNAVHGRTPTSWGVVLQGIFLVIFYILAICLTEHQIL